MPQFVLAVFGNTAKFAAITPEQMERMHAEVGKFNEALIAEERMVFGGGLFPFETAKVVSNVDGENTVTDGPYVKADELISGFWIVEADDMDAALALASTASAACMNHVEVREFAG